MTTPNGATILPKPIAMNLSGDNIIIPATNRGIWVWRFKILLETPTTIQFKAGERELSGPEPCVEQILDYDQFQPWYVCAPGEAFIINLGASVQAGGTAWYTVGP